MAVRSKAQSVKMFFFVFFGICPPPGLLPVLGPCEQYMTPTLDAALLISSFMLKAGVVLVVINWPQRRKLNSYYSSRADNYYYLGP